MTNAYYNRSINPLPTQRVGSNDIKNEFHAVQLGFDQVDVDVDAANAASAAAGASATAAANQAALATSNGAAQVALAQGWATAAEQSYQAAAAFANFKGPWSSLAGALAVPASVHHNGRIWTLLSSLANVATAEPGVSSAWASASGMQVLGYDQRGDLRGSAGQFAVVDGLGLFQHVTGSDEPDDDESCFATATGRWLLQAAHWDVVSMWQLPDDAVRDEYDEDEPLRFASSFASKVLTGTATCAITSVTAATSVTFTGTVTGAAVGDRVLATPPNSLGDTIADTARLSFHAYVSAANTVTVVLCNASASAATTSTAVQAAWPITVFKGV